MKNYGQFLSKAWKEWLETQAGIVAFSALPEVSQGKYLRNRLEVAFQAGADAVLNENAPIIEALRSALREYGRHLSWCQSNGPINYGGSCDCGFNEARKK